MAGANRGLGNRRKVFNRFSENLRAHRPEFRDKYLCPIRLNEFDRSGVEGDTPDLTVEHVIPDGLGQRLLVLTCRICNNEVGGATLDATLHRRADIHAFLRGEKSMRSEVLVGNARLAIDWTHTPTMSSGHPHNDLRVVAKATAPAAIEQSQASLKKFGEGRK